MIECLKWSNNVYYVHSIQQRVTEGLSRLDHKIRGPFIIN